MPVLRPLSPRKPPKNGHRARSENANTGSPAASLWKSCFAEAVDKHLSLPLTATSYPFRYSEIGLNLKELGHRLPNLCISPQVRQSCREAAIGLRSMFLSESFFGRGNRLIETTKTDQCNAHSCKR